MKKIIIISSVLIIAAAAVGAYYYYVSKQEQKITIVTVMPEYGYIAKSITATGAVEPVDTVTVGAQISGLVSKVLVDFNSIVKQGQLLAQIDPTIMEAGTEQAKANLGNAKSNLEFQKNNYDRQSQLFQLGAISKVDYQTALNQYESAKASVANTQAQVKLANKNLFYTNIYSPINGVILNRNISTGQTIASSFNAPVLFVIAKDLTKMQVHANVDEADVGGVRDNQHVSFTVDAFPDDIFTGIVNAIQLHPSVSANVVTYPTIIAVDNKSMKLKPGMTASVNIYTQEDSNALLIPSKAVNFKPDSAALKGYKIIRAVRNSIKKNATAPNTNKEKQRAYVWIKTGDTLTERMIIIGLNDDTHVEILKGLSENEEVITGTATAENKTATPAAAQRSPFMPQMQRKKTDSAAKK